MEGLPCSGGGGVGAREGGREGGRERGKTVTKKESSIIFLSLSF
jgi:hypothetical protein